METTNKRRELIDDEITNIDMHGRRIINASRSVDMDDYIIREELLEVQNFLIAKFNKLQI